MPDDRQPVRRTTEQYQHKEKRFARLMCGHSVEIGFKDAMPYELACPECPPEPGPETA